MMPFALSLPEFHLLRPWWLLALLPALFLARLLDRRRAGAAGWATVIDKTLLDALLDQPAGRLARWPVLMVLAAWVLACLALAGPCFSKQDQRALKQADAVVILLDLSPSMVGTDVSPTRLQAAHYKILDLLRQRREGYTALVAYAGSSHVVAPLSDDTNTIAALVTTLEPSIMPSIGSRPEDAVAEALQLLANAHFPRGRLLLITDGVVPDAVQTINQQLKGKPVELHVIGIGTASGAPIPLQSGGFIKDASGKIVINKLDEAPLQELARENGGQYSSLRPDDGDIAALTGPPAIGGDQRSASHTIEHWQDSGYWLALPCMAMLLLFFRRGMVLCLLVLPLMMMQPSTARAENTPQEASNKDSTLHFPRTWQDWWKTPDQQGADALAQGDVATAAKKFADPQWKAFAEYQNGQHNEAAEHFASSNTASAQYNRGNALAKAGNLQDAIKSYDDALQQQPALEEAKFNRDLVKKILEKQKQQQQKDQKNQQQNQDQNQDQQKQDQQNSDQQQQDQQQDQQQQGQQQQQDQQQQGQQEQQQDQQQGEQQNPQQGQSGEQQQPDGQAGKQSENSPQPAEGKQDDKADQQGKQQDGKQKPEQQDKSKQATDQAKEKESQEHSDQQGDSNQRADNREQQQETEQWLRKVPDDPGGLLRNKFEYYYELDRKNRRPGQHNHEEPRW